MKEAGNSTSGHSDRLEIAGDGRHAFFENPVPTPSRMLRSAVFLLDAGKRGALTAGLPLACRELPAGRSNSRPASYRFLLPAVPLVPIVAEITRLIFVDVCAIPDPHGSRKRVAH